MTIESWVWSSKIVHQFGPKLLSSDPYSNFSAWNVFSFFWTASIAWFSIIYDIGNDVVLFPSNLSSSTSLMFKSFLLGVVSKDMLLFELNKIEDFSFECSGVLCRLTLFKQERPDILLDTLPEFSKSPSLDSSESKLKLEDESDCWSSSDLMSLVVCTFSACVWVFLSSVKSSYVWYNVYVIVRAGDL